MLIQQNYGVSMPWNLITIYILQSSKQYSPFTTRGMRRVKKRPLQTPHTAVHCSSSVEFSFTTPKIRFFVRHPTCKNCYQMQQETLRLRKRPQDTPGSTFSYFLLKRAPSGGGLMQEVCVSWKCTGVKMANWQLQVLCGHTSAPPELELQKLVRNCQKPHFPSFLFNHVSLDSNNTFYISFCI